MAQSDLFKCYVQDYATLPAAANDEITCPILGGEYDKARLKFMAAQAPAPSLPARFVVRIKSNSFSEYPNPNNIDAITGEMRALLTQHGITPTGEPQVCWRAKPNNNWMNDHVDHSEHAHYEDIMAIKPYQIAGGEALVAFEISATDREKLPAMQQTIDALIAQRESERDASRSAGFAR